MEPLKGIKVLDCSTLLPGPYCTMMMRTMGAEVIKVEPPYGDFLRKMLPECFSFLNRGNKSIALNLKEPQGREIIYRMVKDVDVMVEGFRPGVAEKLGIGFEKIKSKNPRVIYVSISGYGQNGPYISHPGHDIDFQAVSGLVSITGDPENRKGTPAGFEASDIAGGMFALTSILAALLGKEREKEWEALYLDLSMTDSLIAWMLPRIVEYFAMGMPKRSDFMARGSYGIFEAKDKKYFSLGVVEEHFWERLCRLIDATDLLEDPELKSWEGRNRNSRKILPRLEKVFLTKERDSWLQLLWNANIPAAPVNEIKDVVQDPQVRFRGLIGVDEENRFAAEKTTPFPIKELTKDMDDFLVPSLGGHTDQILRDLGYSDKEIEKLHEKGVIKGIRGEEEY